jgi:hypothetical protein
LPARVELSRLFEGAEFGAESGLSHPCVAFDSALAIRPLDNGLAIANPICRAHRAENRAEGKPAQALELQPAVVRTSGIRGRAFQCVLHRTPLAAHEIHPCEQTPGVGEALVVAHTFEHGNRALDLADDVVHRRFGVGREHQVELNKKGPT